MLSVFASRNRVGTLTPPIRTCVPEVNPLPLIVNDVPPLAGPEAGLTWPMLRGTESRVAISSPSGESA
jgi:hypothetical protein